MLLLCKKILSMLSRDNPSISGKKKYTSGKMIFFLRAVQVEPVFDVYLQTHAVLSAVIGTRSDSGATSAAQRNLTPRSRVEKKKKERDKIRQAKTRATVVCNFEEQPATTAIEISLPIMAMSSSSYEADAAQAGHAAG